MPLPQEMKKNLTVVVVMGVIGFLLILYFWQMLGKPAVAANDEKVKTYDGEIAEVQVKIDEIEAFKATTDREWDKIQTELEILSKRLPSTEDAPGFYNALRRSLQATGINTQKLNASPNNEYTEYTEIPYAITALGRYHEFGQFINLVEENQRFMRVKTFRLINDPVRPSLHPVNVGIATYMLEKR